jgi:hypothetical protein
MVKKFKLSEAAQAILNEGSQETFASNVASKRGGQDNTQKLPTSVVAGQKDVGEIGQSPEEQDDDLPDYTKGTPSATPPGATPPVGSEPGGKLSGPAETMGRSDLVKPTQVSATDYAAIRDRIAGKMPPQTMMKNPGATFQSYGEETEVDAEYEEEDDSLYDEVQAQVKEDINALLAGENLSEEFVAKATTIFEAAVLTRVLNIKEQLEESLVLEYENAVEELKEDFATKIDDYLSYVIEQWMAKNELAIESGLRAEIVEDFISGLKDLFTENYIDIPEEKVDVVEEMATQVEELELKLNEQIERNIEFKKELNEHKKIEAIHTVCEGLTQTQVEKIKALAENVEYTTEEEFAEKLVTIKESYFPSTIVPASKSALEEGVEIEDEKARKIADPLMEQYAKAISKTIIK